MFCDAEEFINKVENLNNKGDLVFLIDLNLQSDTWDGFKIIDKLISLSFLRIYLMTSDAEKIYVQDFVKNNNIHLIPKDTLAAMNFTKIEDFKI